MCWAGRERSATVGSLVTIRELIAAHGCDILPEEDDICPALLWIAVEYDRSVVSTIMYEIGSIADLPLEAFATS